MKTLVFSELQTYSHTYTKCKNATYLLFCNDMPNILVIYSIPRVTIVQTDLCSEVDSGCGLAEHLSRRQLHRAQRALEAALLTRTVEFVPQTSWWHQHRVGRGGPKTHSSSFHYRRQKALRWFWQWKKAKVIFHSKVKVRIDKPIEDTWSVLRFSEY